MSRSAHAIFNKEYANQICNTNMAVKSKAKTPEKTINFSYLNAELHFYVFNQKMPPFYVLKFMLRCNFYMKVVKNSR